MNLSGGGRKIKVANKSETKGIICWEIIRLVNDRGLKMAYDKKKEETRKRDRLRTKWRKTQHRDDWKKVIEQDKILFTWTVVLDGKKDGRTLTENY